MSRRPSAFSALIAIDKPAGMTSFDVVARVRRAVGEKRVGHAGTLDPAATGVLVVGIGQATKLLGQLTLDRKGYVATFQLGSETTTDDAEGEVTRTAEVPAELLSNGCLAAERVGALVGELDQVPPSFSAGEHAAGRTAEIDAMKDYAAEARKLLEASDAMAKKIIAEKPDLNLFITLGQGAYYGVGNECMNKMKEMGISNSEAYYSMEYRHGPMSLVDENTLLVLLSNEHTEETDAALMRQMKSFGGVTAAIGPNVDKMADIDYALKTENGYSELQAAALMGFIGQFLGYYISRKKNIDADSPRHLTQAIVLK